jgi:hypothetical protein
MSPTRGPPRARRSVPTNADWKRDLTAGMVAAEKAITGYYILGFYTANDKPDGKFRRIKTTLNDNAEAKLDFRQGYYAGKVFSKFTTADKERQRDRPMQAGHAASLLEATARSISLRRHCLRCREPERRVQW